MEGTGVSIDGRGHTLFHARLDRETNTISVDFFERGKLENIGEECAAQLRGVLTTFLRDLINRDVNKIIHEGL